MRRPAPELRLTLIAGGLFSMLLLLIFGDLLLGDGTQAPSHPMGDVAKYFAAIRSFGFGELRDGNLPLWNPHSYSGTPYVGIFQSALFYPPNWLHLVLPLGPAITLEIALNLLLLAVFTFVWMRGQDLHPAAAFFTACTVAFGASCFLRVHGGQLTVIATVAWLPLLLRSLDAQRHGPAPGWRLVGIGAATMILLAGHPPTAFMAGFVTALYCIPLVLGAEQRGPLLASLAWVGWLPLLLSAVQLFTGLAIGGGALREGGASWDFATAFSFPPENLLTLLVPEAFGNADDFDRSYFGRWFYWGASAHIGVVAFLLALHGLIHGRSLLQRTSLVMFPLLAWISMGRYSLLYSLLYTLVPGFAHIRAPSKFIFFATLFAAVLAGIGSNRLLRRPERIALETRQTALVGVSLAALLLGLLIWASLVPADAEHSRSPIVLLSGLNEAASFGAAALDRWQAAFTTSLVRSLVILGIGSLLLWQSGSRRWATWLLVLAGVTEIFFFADSNRGATRLAAESYRRPGLVQTYAKAGTARVLEVDRASNVALYQRGFGLWGYDPVVTTRYSELIAFTQGVDVAELNNISGHQPDRYHPLMRMLRGQYTFWKSGRVMERTPVLPRFVLVRSYEVHQDDAALLAALLEHSFDLHEHVILEKEPAPRPAEGGTRGIVRLMAESTDWMDLEVDLDQPAVLVVSDVHAPGWTARARPGSGQSSYQLLRANYVLRAVPLGAGHHSLRIEYRPTSFRVGSGVSLFGLLLYLVAGGLWWRRRNGPTEPG